MDNRYRIVRNPIQQVTSEFVFYGNNDYIFTIGMVLKCSIWEEPKGRRILFPEFLYIVQMFGADIDRKYFRCNTNLPKERPIFRL